MFSFGFIHAQDINCDSLYHGLGGNQDILVFPTETMPVFDGEPNALNQFLYKKGAPYAKKGDVVVLTFIVSADLNILCPEIVKPSGNHKLDDLLISSCMDLVFEEVAKIAGRPVPCMLNIRVGY